MQTRDDIETEIRKRLSNNKSAIQRLKAQAEQSSDEGRVAALKKIDELNRIVALVESRLETIKSDDDDTWLQTKRSLEEYWHALGRELEAYDPSEANAVK